MAGTVLHDDIWHRRGISLLWDADSLSTICTPQQVVSLRRFLQLHALGWPEAQVSLVNDKVLVVAGLESAIDALPPEESSEWLERVVYAAIVGYQTEVAYGGTEAALVLWFTDFRRFHYNTSDDTYYWHCTTEYKGRQIPISRCLFNGGQADARRIHTVDAKRDEHWVGLYHPKVKS
ncbi:MAG: hypothetical protein SH850_24580 [Planctomycetaceae bacterium]|nr:hypothetical protein [Planctomycetaceae bacterium]